MNKNIWVTPMAYRGEDYPKGPTPFDANLKHGNKYVVINYFEDESWDGENSVTIVNDDGEIWSISNRHLRVAEIQDLNGNTLFYKDY